MMVKVKGIFVCSKCGNASSKWQGRCFSCGEFGTLEEKKVTSAAGGLQVEKLAAEAQNDLSLLSEVDNTKLKRLKSGFAEFDRVLGGGVIQGSTVLLAGEPGLGKSTLLLQIASTVQHSLPALYVTAEESVSQIKLRANRLLVDEKRVMVCSETNVDVIIELVKQISPQIGMVIVDSIQALASTDIDSFTGSITQVKEGARRLSVICKKLSLPLILVGHVTKAGVIAGPKTLEHLVDVVLYLEGQRFSDVRILRAVKNRYGSVFEVGVFTLGDKGLKEILDPSSFFTDKRKIGIPGSVMTVILEGLRPLVLEVQALTSHCQFEIPLRNVTGIGHKRLLMLLAVLQRRLKVNFSRHNVFVNISGGVKVFETGVDLPVCLALLSSLKDQVIEEQVVAFGEVGLLGEIKEVTHQPERIKAAQKMGFTKIISSQQVSEIKEVFKIIGWT